MTSINNILKMSIYYLVNNPDQYNDKTDVFIREERRLRPTDSTNSMPSSDAWEMITSFFNKLTKYR